MKTIAKTLMVLLCLGGVSLAGEARLEDIVKAMVGAIDKITTTLADVKDEATAKAAHPELKKNAAEWDSLRKRAESVPPPTPAERERLKKEFTGKLEEAQKKLFAEISRVQGVPGGKEALREVARALDRKAK